MDGLGGCCGVNGAFAVLSLQRLEVGLALASPAGLAGILRSDWSVSHVMKFGWRRGVLVSLSACVLQLPQLTLFTTPDKQARSIYIVFVRLVSSRLVTVNYLLP